MVRPNIVSSHAFLGVPSGQSFVTPAPLPTHSNTVTMSLYYLNSVSEFVISFENWVLRRIFGPERDEVTGEWRKLHTEELNGLYCLTFSLLMTHIYVVPHR
jgi:hypothetical protein